MRDLLNLLNNTAPTVEKNIINPNNIETDNLDAEPDRPRLRGPGARTAKAQVEPKTDAATLGRERRKRI